ncbi:MAG TPA: 8-amino-7-oxononanoate synthase [Candidatus Binatia bacterium]
MSGPADALARERLAGLERDHLRRFLRRFDGAQGPRMTVDGRDVVVLASSNYLGLAAHPRVIEGAARAARDWGTAAGGSRLICGHLGLHEELEERLAALVGFESALTFATGYQANATIIPALVGPGDVVVSDELAHASVVDGVRLSKAAVRVVPHNDHAALSAALDHAASGAAAGGAGGRCLVVLDGVYSMDGDVAPLREMLAHARRAGAMVLLDDAHGIGVLGANGRGVLEHAGLGADDVDVLVGTLGKAIGSFGAFVACSRVVREYLLNVARGFVFSCALAPPALGAALAALAVLEEEPWRRIRVLEHAARLRRRVGDAGFDTGASETQIVPVLIGENAPTMALCEALLARGYYAQGIRWPSVARGTARLRLTALAEHEPRDLDAAADALVDAAAEVGVRAAPRVHMA